MSPLARFSLLGLAVTALVMAGGATAGKGGPSPGVEIGGQGIASIDGKLRYVADRSAGATLVTALDADGRAVRRGSLAGVFGVPRVAFDGTLDGLAHDGRRLVLASASTVGGKSRFAVLSTKASDCCAW